MTSKVLILEVKRKSRGSWSKLAAFQDSYTSFELGGRCFEIVWVSGGLLAIYTGAEKPFIYFCAPPHGDCAEVALEDVVMLVRNTPPKKRPRRK